MADCQSITFHHATPNLNLSNTCLVELIATVGASGGTVTAATPDIINHRVPNSLGDGEL